jgi:hypothetical protein
MCKECERLRGLLDYLVGVENRLPPKENKNRFVI